MLASERLYPMAGSLEPFSERCGCDGQRLSRLRGGQFENLAENVRRPVGSIEALKHPKSAADLYFFDENRPLALGGTIVRKPFDEIFPESIEGQIQLLDWALLDVEDVVHGDSKDPSGETTSKVELSQTGDDADEDFLRRVLGVLAVPKHSQCESIDIALERPNQPINGVA